MLSIFRTIGRILPFLGKLGKGKATVTGAIACALGLTTKHFIGDVLTADNFVESIKATAEIIAALGTFVAAFGIGRKAGYAATTHG